MPRTCDILHYKNHCYHRYYGKVDISWLSSVTVTPKKTDKKVESLDIWRNYHLLDLDPRFWGSIILANSQYYPIFITFHNHHNHDSKTLYFPMVTNSWCPEIPCYNHGRWPLLAAAEIRPGGVGAAVSLLENGWIWAENRWIESKRNRYLYKMS